MLNSIENISTNYKRDYMKTLKKLSLHILFWIYMPFLILYFKWAAQDTNSLPGLPAILSENYFEFMRSNLDIIIVSLLGSLPVFFRSLIYLNPKLLFKTNALKFTIFMAGLVAYYFLVRILSGLVLPMYYFFGTPYAIKVLAPIILLSALSGTLFALNEKPNQ